MRALLSRVSVALLLVSSLTSVGCATGVDERPADDGTRPSQDVTCTTGQSTMTAFSAGPLFPTAVCIGIDDAECAANDGTAIVSCNGDKGVCLATGTHQLCLPQCTFDDSGKAPVGCAGKDVCNVYGWGRDTGGKVYGIGYCFGGCRADRDCPTGSSCQREEGLCVTTKKSYAKISGMPCTKAEATGTSPACNCMYGTTSGKGYCADFCVVGQSTCGAGSVCSPSLATSDTTGPLFSHDPTGMAGSCVRTCTSDVECAPINARCQTTATGKVCQPT